MRTLTDAHAHIAQIENWRPFLPHDRSICVCACAQTPGEFEKLERLKELYPQNVLCAFALHPLEAAAPNAEENLQTLHALLSQSRCDAVGECGFDLRNAELRGALDLQKKLFAAQLGLAAQHQKPLIIHNVRAVHVLFEYSAQMAKLPSVVFHGWGDTLNEAESLLRKGINAYFSLGKSLLGGKKSAAECAAKLPLERLLLETDAPFMALKGEAATGAADIIRVYQAAFALRGDAPSRAEAFEERLYCNFCSAFCSSGMNSW